jgi:hypothetical protein
MFAQDLVYSRAIGVGDLSKILSGAEAFPRSGKINGSYFMEAGAFIQSVLQQQGHFLVEGIELIGAVEGNESDLIADLK